jgi:hypothetical protein
MATRPCIERRCPRYAKPGGSRCEEHESEFERRRRADPMLTGRRGTSAEWARARGLALWRARYTCQGCRRTKREVQRLGGRLEVHHRDGDATNNRQGNLAVLCSLGCHRRADKSVPTDRGVRR